MNPETRKLLLVLLALSALLHLYRLDEPREVIFDEVHFGAFVNSYCCTGEYLFDIHPPHSKLAIAAIVGLTDYRGGQSFDEIHSPYVEASAFYFRLVPALSGTVLPLVIFAFLLQLGSSRMAAFLGGLAVVLDNALLLQTRVVALDGSLLVALFGALGCYLAAFREDDRLRRTLLAFAAGVLAGWAAGTKFTGLLALGLIGLGLGIELLRKRDLASLRRTASLTVWVLSGAVLIYFAGWAIHFALLDQHGPGEAFGKPTGKFMLDTIRLHQTMFSVNYGLSATHPYASPWWSWPLMLRPVFYWSSSGGHIYLLGNPVVWWGSTLALIGSLSTLVFLRISDLQVPSADKPCPPLLWLPLCGFVASLVPIVFVPRVLFIYHYFAPLLFGLCVVLLWLDHVGWVRAGGWRKQRRSYAGVVAALFVGFLLVSPFSFAFVDLPIYTEFVFEIFPSWR